MLAVLGVLLKNDWMLFCPDADEPVFFNVAGVEAEGVDDFFAIVGASASSHYHRYNLRRFRGNFPKTLRLSDRLRLPEMMRVTRSFHFHVSTTRFVPFGEFGKMQALSSHHYAASMTSPSDLP